MRGSIYVVVAMLMLGLLPAFGQAEAVVGEAAPAFTLKGVDGREYSLSDFKGKYVVLEWVNYDCPFVRRHYGSGNMQGLQKEYTAEGVVWLSICSSAPGKQGYFDIPELKERMQKAEAVPTAYLTDPKGEVGRKYEAKTTPHMFVINPEGVLLYAGAIDDRPSTSVDDNEGATNYVRAALDAAMQGKPVEVQTSKPYGCSVKY
ncbi:MAG: thioredoxin family protein [Ignavibacteria bacterium]|nr:thioredoxin family protein [Ignavibacteria bacterium]